MSIEADNHFFTLEKSGNDCRIIIKANFLDFEHLSLCRELREIALNRTFRITGRSSIEAYFCLGFLLANWGASCIIGVGAKQDEQLKIDHLQHNLCATSKKWLNCHINEQGENMAEVRPADSQDGKWAAEDLEFDVPSKLLKTADNSLHLTGLGSVWMYLQLGISAALAGIKDVFISKPRLPYEIHINSEGLCEAHTVKKDSKHGIVVGILGDPNSGKSVFSRNFAITIRLLMPSWFATWIYDCDLASPTPDWYLNDSEATKEQRNAIKRPWTPELEEKAANDLKVLRNNLDLTLADMPGGRRVNDQSLIRIPSPTRALMMKECDAFIVLCRQDRQDEIFDAWRQALSDYHLENRIIARIVSANPEGDFDISSLQTNHEGQFFTTIYGLSRDKDRTQIIRTMEEKLSPLAMYLSKINSTRDV